MATAEELRNARERSSIFAGLFDYIQATEQALAEEGRRSVWGGLLSPVPQGLLFRDVYDAMEGGVTKSGQPFNEAHRTHAIKTKMPAQVITPEIVDRIIQYLATVEE